MNYEDLGLDPYLRSLNSPSNRITRIPPLQFDSLYEVQTKNVSVSSLNSANLVQLSNGVTASGSVAAGTHVHLNTTLSPNLSVLGTAYKNFANPFVAIYEGTAAVGSMQIFPGFGGGISADKFRFASGFDYAALGNGTASTYRVRIHNTTGTTAQIFAETKWKILEYSSVNNL